MTRICKLLGLLSVMTLAAAAATAQNSDDVIRIGVLDDMSGVFSDSSGPGNVVSAQLAAEDLGGKVAGRRIEIVSADHQNKPDIGASIARQWFDQGGVDAIVGLGNSAVALAVSELGAKSNRAILASGAISSLLTGAKCNPLTLQWTVDGYSLTNAAVRGLMAAGEDTWFFVTVDYAFGLDLEQNAARFVKDSGGKVVGSVRHPLNSLDFSSFILQAQASKAKVVALANGGQDMSKAVKQAQEFGLVRGQKLVGLTVTIDEVHSLGLKSAGGLQLATPFYWDMDENTRTWSRRFAARMNGKMPSMMQAGAYSAALHYLKAVAAAATDDGKAVIDKMKALPTEDPVFGSGSVRQDGRKLHPMHLYEVKSPEESKGAWDYQKLIRTLPADQVFRPMSEGGCPFVKS
jgi:branched-chain amino acid transport system substrate-binding protein